MVGDGSQFGLRFGTVLVSSLYFLRQAASITASQHSILAQILAEWVFVLVVEVPLFDIGFVSFDHHLALDNGWLSSERNIPSQY